MTLPAGKIIGNDEITKLNQAGITSIEVVTVGITDLLPDPALNSLTQALAGHGLTAMPARANQALLTAAHQGILRFPPAVLTAIWRLSKMAISISANANFSLNDKGATCATLTAHPILLPRTSIKETAAVLPHMQVSELQPLQVCYLAANDPSESPTLSALTKALGACHSPLRRAAKPVATDELVVALATGQLAATANQLGITPITTAPKPQARWLAGTRQNLPALVIDAQLKQLPASLRRLLHMLHGGIKLDADALTAAAARPTKFLLAGTH